MHVTYARKHKQTLYLSMTDQITARKSCCQGMCGAHKKRRLVTVRVHGKVGVLISSNGPLSILVKMQGQQLSSMRKYLAGSLMAPVDNNSRNRRPSIDYGQHSIQRKRTTKVTHPMHTSVVAIFKSAARGP